ncbi:hypothetical protein DNTS_021035 [Danionella cerebrum]|uniref:Uncharacterized protein n=1 Tax=Danionella cerebrum TaxID=2873325 RepID=A0A553MU38_9TELE|nr:hypothetical protein DNTS_021035 [Danionella translucida]
MFTRGREADDAALFLCLPFAVPCDVIAGNLSVSSAGGAGSLGGFLELSSSDNYTNVAEVPEPVPVPIPKAVSVTPVPVMVSDDPNPRMKIHNRCPERILLKESGREYVRLLPALSSVHHELFYQALSFPECKAKETLPALLLRIFTDTPAVTPTFKIDPDTLNTSLETPTPSSWTDPIDINSPGTQVNQEINQTDGCVQVVFLPGFGCLYVDILHESGCITLTLAAESSATELINTHRSPGSSLFFTFVLREATVCLCDDLSSQSSSIELLRLSISRLMLLLEPSQNSSFDPTVCSLAHTLTLRCAHLQLDNQLYQRASFHFPVILSPEPPSNEDFLSLRITLCPNIKPQQLTLSVCPARVYLEDTFIYYLRTLIQTYIPEPTKVGRILNRSVEHEVPSAVLEALQALVSPLALQSLCVEPLTLTVSVHASLKIYIASDHTPLSFTLFQRSGVCTTPRQLTHTLAMHYAAGALFRAGWVVGSLEILGSPASLVRSIGNGVSDFFRLPYEGLTRGPGAFISGVSRGTNSFIKHISKGTLTSITNLATSVSRNMDRLSLDEEHFTRQEEWRREHPESLGEGLRHGLSRLGLSLLGIVDQPMQSFTRPQDLPDSSSLSSSSSLARGFISGVGRGIVGAFTKPIGGAAELVSQTGYGLLHGAGLWQLPQQLHPPIETRSADASNSHLKYLWYQFQIKINPLYLFSDLQKKMLGALGGAELHMAIEVSVCNSSSSSGVSQERGGCLLLSSEVLFVVSVCEDAQQQAFPITEVQCHTLTPGRITLTLQQHRASSDPESLSSSSLPQQSPASSSSGCVSKVYEYQADDAFARVFVSKFHAVKNRALRIGFN